MSHYTEKQWIPVNVAYTPAVTDTALHDLISWQLNPSIFIYAWYPPCFTFLWSMTLSMHDILDSSCVFLFVFFVKGQLCGLCDTDGLQSSGVQSNCSCKADFFIVTKTFMCKESIPVFLFVCFLKNISVTRSVLQLDNLVTWIRFKAFILLIVTSFVCVCVCARVGGRMRLVVHMSCILFVTQSTGWEVGD